ncbi:MAG: RagB/SusD family nutrient uptake outer membrane protein [Phocaeicola plebeius]|uniref:RagB/SusD family nutrient uptake outer membrane protein n=1 Tax=Phocaeicola plebeius TaxID=310297 RepID=UPI0030489125
MKNKVLILLSIAGLFASCNDAAFLRENPETFYTPENAYTSSEQVKQIITTCYQRVRDIYCPFDNGSMLNVWSYRMGNGTDIIDVPNIRPDYRLNDYSINTPESGVYYDTYANFYYMITSANTAIDVANRPNISWDSEDDKKYVLAQARFFRAFAYRNLGELFGGVPIVTEVISTPRYDYQRTTRLETYQFAIDELEAILNDLPETINEAGRLVRAAAQHNLCQLYIDKGVALKAEGADPAKAYQTAVTYANAIIDSGLYALMEDRFGTRKNENPKFYFATKQSEKTEDRLYTKAGVEIKGNVFWDLFQMGNQDYQDGNKEAIWCAQSDYDVYKEEGDHLRLDYPGIYGPVFRDMAGAHMAGDQEDSGGFGMCQVMPTPYTRDIIYEGKWADDMRNSDAVFRRTIVGNVKTSPYFGKVIPWDVLYQKDANGNYNEACYTQLYPISVKIGPDFFSGAEDGLQLRSIFRDDYLIRLSETILLRAEAKLRLNDKLGAAEDVNKLRRRAQCGYLVTADDMNIDLILDERARELIYEESRWNTLLRMEEGIAIERIKKYSYWDYPRTTLNGKSFAVWPIPQKVIDTNKDVRLEQNKGW